MAIHTECNVCANYKGGVCTRSWSEPTFDGSSCEMYPDNGESPGSNPTERPIDDEPQAAKRQIRRRGSSATGRVSILGERSVEVVDSDAGGEKYGVEVVVPSWWNGKIVARVLAMIGVALLLFFAKCGLPWILQYIRDNEKEDVALEAKALLHPLRDTKLMEFITLDNMCYDGEAFAITLGLHINMKQYPFVPDTTIADHEMGNAYMKQCYMLAAMTAIPEQWDAVCHLLDSAGLDLKVRFTPIGDSCIVPHKELVSLMSSSEKFTMGIQLFVHHKIKEVYNYARLHFYNDIYLHVDSVSLSPEFVTLHLWHNDTIKLTLGYTHEGGIPVHFTDPVGKMGSISDNMFSISKLTGCGIAFEYAAKKAGKVVSTERWEWDADRTQQFLETYVGDIGLEGRPTNTVKSVIIRK